MRTTALPGDMPRLDSYLWGAADTTSSLGSLVNVVQQGLSLAHDPVTVETLIADNADRWRPWNEGRGDSELRTARARTSLLRVYDDAGSFVVSAWPTAYKGVFHTSAPCRRLTAAGRGSSAGSAGQHQH